MRDHRCVRGSAAGRQFLAERLRPGLGLASGPAGFRRPQVATCARPARATSCASRTSESSQVPRPRPLILFAVTVTKGHRWDIRVPGHWQTGFPPPEFAATLRTGQPAGRGHDGFRGDISAVCWGPWPGRGCPACLTSGFRAGRPLPWASGTCPGLCPGRPLCFAGVPCPPGRGACSSRHPQGALLARS